jgi:histone-lysine N-methyltransferase SETD1
MDVLLYQSMEGLIHDAVGAAAARVRFLPSQDNETCDFLIRALLFLGLGLAEDHMDVVSDSERRLVEYTSELRESIDQTTMGRVAPFFESIVSSKPCRAAANATSKPMHSRRIKPLCGWSKSDKAMTDSFGECRDARVCNFCKLPAHDNPHLLELAADAIAKQFGDIPQADLVKEISKAGRLIPIEAGRHVMWAHVNCAQWSSEAHFGAGALDANVVKNMPKAVTRGRMMICNLCGMKGATVGCSVQHCKKTFHFLCARQSQCTFFTDRKVFCSSHGISTLEGNAAFERKQQLLELEQVRLKQEADAAASQEEAVDNLLPGLMSHENDLIMAPMTPDASSELAPHAASSLVLTASRTSPLDTVVGHEDSTKPGIPKIDGSGDAEVGEGREDSTKTGIPKIDGSGDTEMKAGNGNGNGGTKMAVEAAEAATGVPVATETSMGATEGASLCHSVSTGTESSSLSTDTNTNPNSGTSASTTKEIRPRRRRQQAAAPVPVAKNEVDPGSAASAVAVPPPKKKIWQRKKKDETGKEAMERLNRAFNALGGQAKLCDVVERKMFFTGDLKRELDDLRSPIYSKLPGSSSSADPFRSTLGLTVKSGAKSGAKSGVKSGTNKDNDVSDLCTSLDNRGASATQKRSLAVRIGTLTVHSFGIIVADRSGFHSKSAIYPVGFVSSRIHWSYRHPTQRCVYVMEVLDGHQISEPASVATPHQTPNKLTSQGSSPVTPVSEELRYLQSRPVFRITCSDDLQEPIVSESIGDAYGLLKKRIDDARARLFPKAAKLKQKLRVTKSSLEIEELDGERDRDASLAAPGPGSGSADGHSSSHGTSNTAKQKKEDAAAKAALKKEYAAAKAKQKKEEAAAKVKQKKEEAAVKAKQKKEEAEDLKNVEAEGKVRPKKAPKTIQCQFPDCKQKYATEANLARHCQLKHPDFEHGIVLVASAKKSKKRKQSSSSQECTTGERSPVREKSATELWYSAATATVPLHALTLPHKSDETQIEPQTDDRATFQTESYNEAQNGAQGGGRNEAEAVSETLARTEQRKTRNGVEGLRGVETTPIPSVVLNDSETQMPLTSPPHSLCAENVPFDDIGTLNTGSRLPSDSYLVNTEGSKRSRASPMQLAQMSESTTCTAQIPTQMALTMDVDAAAATHTAKGGESDLDMECHPGPVPGITPAATVSAFPEQPRSEVAFALPPTTTATAAEDPVVAGAKDVNTMIGIYSPVSRKERIDRHHAKRKRAVYPDVTQNAHKKIALAKPKTSKLAPVKVTNADKCKIGPDRATTITTTTTTVAKSRSRKAPSEKSAGKPLNLADRILKMTGNRQTVTLEERTAKERAEANNFFGFDVPIIKRTIESLPHAVACVLPVEQLALERAATKQKQVPGSLESMLLAEALEVTDGPVFEMYRFDYVQPQRAAAEEVLAKRRLGYHERKSELASGCARTEARLVEYSEKKGGLKRRDVIDNISSENMNTSTSTGDKGHKAKSKSGGDFSDRNEAMQQISRMYRTLKTVPWDSRLLIKRSAIHGWGLFALAPITPHSMIVEYMGEVLRENVADIREKKYEESGEGSCYLFRLNRDHIVDATKQGCMARFVNHCCDPCAYARVITVENDQQKIVMFATRHIKTGEEITYDYKFPFEEEKIPCNCGAANCVGRMN